ncbi:hypothetical protein BJY16_008295 [Actinoplanes octamycinicus]|uniref:DUF11 domain-containing protein n=1 Tax=Actinoplanes octamycinicus TaxID=135948 RepID=A0A7W7H6B4_9ACTN|nr:hypothetical protein [Actinoplanes octamycinicus]MBB4744836.1 hypothetical protein [Actinoplanes octamycinicus]GIE55422.1 hypothetical protein Aoc01nite_08240 [Actinoplanes octamycinicus]
MRTKRGLALAGALAALALAAPGTAHAAEAGPIRVEAEDVLIPVGNAAASVTVTLANPGDEGVLLHNVKVTLDAAGLAGVATVADLWPATGGDCATAGTVTTCSYETLDVSIIDAYPLHASFKADKGVAAGAKGTYRVTAQADDLPVSEATGAVTVAEAVNLIAGPEIKLSGKPGATVGLSPTVRNAGGATVHGAVLSSSTGSSSAAYVARYKNCFYTDVQFYCTFDQDLAPGRQYGLSAPIDIAISKDAPAPSEFDTYAEWETPDDAKDWVASIRDHGAKPGTGPELRLVEKAAVRSGPQTDVTAIDNFSHVVTAVTGKNLPDLTVVGGTVRGKVGDTVKAKFGVKNLGPARIDAWNHFPSVLVTIPAGTTLVTADRNCGPVEGKAGTFRCLTGELAVGASATWELSLKITNAAPSTGAITARIEVVGTTTTFAPEANAANNTGKLLLNPATAGDNGDAAGDGDEAAGGTGGGDSDEPSLPITGANVAWVAGAGLVLLAAGVIALLAAKRRGTRYTA